MPRKKVTAVPDAGAVQETPAAQPVAAQEQPTPPAETAFPGHKPGVFQLASGATLIRN